ncbi:transport permease protein [Arenicella chitinivorans]|uniref:Transport permease protein n=1 Tax=Arenicella chitinivorans TaxID=1329800 RepID=A0A918RPY9_9GAMM|nr:ABC transporter permease [Arenicella chitinivorans]GHA08424.1 transport permease protein [Arenicella chitinivorans]
MQNPKKASADDWDQIIEPHDKLLNLKLGELWRYRDLIYLFVRRDFVAQYKQTILGPTWHILQPLLTTIVFTIVFGRIAKMPTDGVPPFVFFLSGTVIWTYFANVITDTSVTFSKNAHVFGKVYFPRLVTPIATTLSKLIAFAIQFLFFIAYLAYLKLTGVSISPNLWVFATPALLLALAMLALSCGLLITAMTTRYQDLAVLVSFGVQLAMYASPVIYPISSLPEKWQFWANLNPIAPILECFRYAFLGVGQFQPQQLIYSGIVISLMFMFSAIVFSRVERTFADTI